MEWVEWLRKLYAALRLDERCRYERYILAHGEPKKWRWFYHLEYIEKFAVTPENVERIMLDAFGVRHVKTHGIKGSIKEYAEMRGWRKVLQLEDGSFTYEDGTEAELPEGYTFVSV